MVNLYDVLNPGVDLASIRARLKRYVMVHPDEGGCWVLRNHRHGDSAFYLRKRETKLRSNNIYFRRDGKYYSARRLSYLLEHGEIPEGKYVKNTCGIFGCICPEHLTLADNVGGT